MHLKKDFITQTIGNKQMMIAVGEAGDTFHGLVRSNETAAFIVDMLKNETTEDRIVAAILAEYDVDEATAQKDVNMVIEKLSYIGAIE